MKLQYNCYTMYYDTLLCVVQELKHFDVIACYIESDDLAYFFSIDSIDGRGVNLNLNQSKNKVVNQFSTYNKLEMFNFLKQRHDIKKLFWCNNEMFYC
ncbi:ORF_9 [Adoxophyes orana granulovirus]|uniref:ADOR9 n=1 Tax=Adoxophyes orana granulovirus TaxID=170617 RepID=Q7TA06_GVAO|nr:ORF_9 [Adoxophyes orana granulovirus]AAP85646.1 ORF_9 [Adoxophyes orana granulovirus]AJA91649.1 ADOR9 [Adoxophyes orana granulovirus]